MFLVTEMWEVRQPCRLIIIHSKRWQEKEMSCRIQYFPRTLFNYILSSKEKCLFQFWQILSFPFFSVALCVTLFTQRRAWYYMFWHKRRQLSFSFRFWPIVINLLIWAKFLHLLLLLPAWWAMRRPKSKLLFRNHKYTAMDLLTCFVIITPTNIYSSEQNA